MSDLQDTDVDGKLRHALAPGQNIAVGQAFGFPSGIVASLSEHPELLAGSQLLFGMIPDPRVVLPRGRIETFFPSGPLGTTASLETNNAAYTRQSLHTISRDIKDGVRSVDVAIATARPLHNGRYCLGLGSDFIHPAAERAHVVLLEIIDDLPWTGVSNTIPNGPHVIAVQSQRRAPVMTEVPSSDAQLASHLMAFVPDGATLELGMGKWSSAFLVLLAEQRRGLRLHTGSAGDWMGPLLRSGAVDVGAGVIVTAAGGTRAFYDAMTELGVSLAPAHVTHNPTVLSALPCFRAINSVLEVDLLGRANSEYGANGRRGGLGGLPDYASGAKINPDGLSIVALNSEAGEISRIAVRLPEQAVSLDETQVEIIVTEHGSADLRGKAPQERARAILNVAAPSHRDALARQAHDIGVL